MSKMKLFLERKLDQYWTVIAWSALIFILSSIPTLPEVGFIWWDFLIKKGAHVFMYAVLYNLSYTSHRKIGNFRTPLLFCLAFALSDEYHQSFVHGRTAKLMDVGFDSLGMFIAYSRLKMNK